jgi:hypothetical protein
MICGGLCDDGSGGYFCGDCYDIGLVLLLLIVIIDGYMVVNEVILVDE